MNGSTNDDRIMVGIDAMLTEGRSIWGPKPVPFEVRDVLTRLTVSMGDIARVARGASKDPRGSEAREELQKELGNIIFSTVRFADDLGLNPIDCVRRAIEAQRKFAKANPDR